MNCEQSQNLFDAYLDKSLSGTMATEFGAHQLACSRCRRELALLEVTGHVIATDSGSPLLNDEFTHRLVECATNKPAHRPLKFSRALWIGLPAAMAACLTLIVWLGGDGASKVTESNIDAPRVLGVVDEVTTSDELLENVLEALSLDPDNKDLKALADKLRAKSEKIIGDTRDGASLLQDYSEDAIRELVGSAPASTRVKPTESGSTESGSNESGGASGSQDEAMQGRQKGSLNAGSDADKSTNSNGAKPPTEEL
jgi:hypothetical protein